MQLTLQLYLAHRWQDAAVLEFPEPDRGTRGRVRLGYLQNHALAWMFRDDEHACSLTLPVELMMKHQSPRWFGFLEDIMPAGASRRYWVEHLGLQDDPRQPDPHYLVKFPRGHRSHDDCDIPVFDFAPMKADPEGVTRTTRWGSPFEEGGEFDWHAISEALADLASPARMLDELMATAARLVGLRDRLRDRGVPERILTMPAVGLPALDERLARWGLA